MSCERENSDLAQRKKHARKMLQEHDLGVGGRHTLEQALHPRRQLRSTQACAPINSHVSNNQPRTHTRRDRVGGGIA